MKKVLFALALCGLVSTSEAEENVRDPVTVSKAESGQPVEHAPGSSGSIRGQSNWTVLLNPAGGGTPGMRAGSLGLAKHFGSQWQLLLEGRAGDFRVNGNEIIRERSTSIRSLGVHSIGFGTHNSSYARLGLSYRWAKNDTELKSGDRFTELDGRSLDFEYAIGNAWSWDRFTFGVDWIGGRASVKSWIDREALVYDDYKTGEGMKEELLTGSSMRFFTLYVGAHF